jgi:putative ABC transport system substrate-binding protein
MNPAADDPEGKARLTAFVQGLQQSGWTDGRNVRIDTRWAGANAADIRRHVAELVALTPAAILATGSAVTGPLVQATHSVPIVFVLVPDPVGAGFVDSLARPGGNATGFLSFEYGLSGKWLTILKEIAPSVTRAGVIRDPAITAGIGQFAAIQSCCDCSQPLLAHKSRPYGGQLQPLSEVLRTCRDSVALKLIRAFDPLRKSGRQFCCGAQHGFSTMW